MKCIMEDCTTDVESSIRILLGMSWCGSHFLKGQHILARCSDPEKVSGYELWQVLKGQEKMFTSPEISDLPTTSRSVQRRVDAQRRNDEST